MLVFLLMFLNLPLKGFSESFIPQTKMETINNYDLIPQQDFLKTSEDLPQNSTIKSPSSWISTICPFMLLFRSAVRFILEFFQPPEKRTLFSFYSMISSLFYFSEYRDANGKSCKENMNDLAAEMSWQPNENVISNSMKKIYTIVKIYHYIIETLASSR